MWQSRQEQKINQTDIGYLHVFPQHNIPPEKPTVYHKLPSTEVFGVAKVYGRGEKLSGKEDS